MAGRIALACAEIDAFKLEAAVPCSCQGVAPVPGGTGNEAEGVVGILHLICSATANQPSSPRAAHRMLHGTANVRARRFLSAGR